MLLFGRPRIGHRIKTCFWTRTSFLFPTSSCYIDDSHEMRAALAFLSGLSPPTIERSDVGPIITCLFEPEAIRLVLLRQGGRLPVRCQPFFLALTETCRVEAACALRLNVKELYLNR